MSRSFHTTRKRLEEAEKYDYADAETRAASIQRLKERLHQKRLTKVMARESRKTKGPLPPTLPAAIPIHVRDESEFVHYPAGSDDIRSVLQALPQGITDQLTEIELCLGQQNQLRPEDEWAVGTEPDPHVGRQGSEILPGIFSGDVLGTYYPGQAKLRIYAYVGRRDALDRVPVEFYLRMCMLETLIHEVAHHYDFSSRIARGRWMADDRDKVEIYAEKVQHDWFARYVSPYLKSAYPDQWKAFADWVRDHVGIEMPVELLLGDPRTTVRGDRISLRGFFNTRWMFRAFLETVLQGGDLQNARLEFADKLHFAEHYEPALQIIDILLQADRDNIEALDLQADIFNHVGRHEEALTVSRQVLQRESLWADALGTQANALMGLGRYDEAIAVLDRAMESAGQKPYRASWQYKKTEALIELGRYTEAEDILAWLEQATARYRHRQRRIKSLRKKCRRARKRRR